MKAISVRAPWWWFILHAGKDIENRDWPTSFRGTVLIHASKWFGLQDVKDDWEYAAGIYKQSSTVRPAAFYDGMTLRALKDRGGSIVGKVDIVDCVSKSASPWFNGEYGFVIQNPVAFARPIPFKGALGLFWVPDEVIGTK